MKTAERLKKIISILKKEFPGATTALYYASPMQLLVATILSAQCTDKRVNYVTKTLFRKYRFADDFARARVKTFEKEIRSTGFYRNKAKNIIGAARMVIEKFGGKVPDTMEELIKLPGVARKTANIVLSHGYGKIEGIAVDTHVRRLSGRLGLTRSADPVKIEQDLMKLTIKKNWPILSDLLIAHGRKTCMARKPKCPGCVLNAICPSARGFYPNL